MIGHKFSKYIPKPAEEKGFEQLLHLFLQLLQYTNGDVAEALDWLNQLDSQHHLTNNAYGMGNFIQDLKDKGYIQENPADAQFSPTAKTNQSIRKNSLEEVFGKLKKGPKGNHTMPKSGMGDEQNSDVRSYAFGDSLDQIDLHTSILNAQINHGIGEFKLTEDDLAVRERDYKTQTSTVLMIDISHSMILYGEDRITPAKKVAMALVELIHRKYPKDGIDVLVFGNEAWPIPIQELPYLKVGPYHTNTVAGLELAMDILRRKRNTNKQIFMITDGKPSCVKLPSGELYMNPNGLDEFIVSKCLNQAAQARKLKIPITTFMIAQDPYLRQFVERFTAQNQGKAFLTGLSDLGQMLFEDYEKNRIKKI
jgi:uncharacterized protein with von Willebrand factor type A (vWA) domain